MQKGCFQPLIGLLLESQSSLFNGQRRYIQQTTTVLSAGNGGALSRQKNSGGCGRLPLDSGSAGSHDGTQGFPVGVEAGGFTSP